MNNLNTSNPRIILVLGLLILVLLILGAGQIVLAQQDQPSAATPSVWPTELSDLGTTATASLPVTATLETPAFSTPLPEDWLTPTSTHTGDQTSTQTLTPTSIPDEDVSSGLPQSTLQVTPMLIVSPTVTITPTITVTPTVTATIPSIRLPLIMSQPTQTPAPYGTLLSCRSTSAGIPDNNPAGIQDSIWIDDTRAIRDLNLRLSANHNWIGDLEAYLTRCGEWNHDPPAQPPGLDQL